MPNTSYYTLIDDLSRREKQCTEFKLPSPHRFGWILDESSCEVTLDTADHVMVWRFSALADDSKSMVLHNGGATDSAQETLLYSTVKAENGDFGRWLKAYFSRCC